MINFDEIPDWWAVCPYEECPKAGECLRHQACKVVPERFLQWPCVLPHVRRADGCVYYQKAEKVRMARGMKSLFNHVPDRRAAHDIRTTLMAIFGSNAGYYRYRDGERWMNPELQETIQEVLRRNGCTEEGQFDEYAEAYDFTVKPELK